METFRVHVLGCGSARPSLRHNASAQVVEMRGKMLMVDCAEGTQMQLMRAKINFNKIKAVFISHLHGDHCFGLLGLISSFGLLGRTAPLLVAAPKQLEPIFHQAMPLFCANLGYDVEFMPLDTKKAAVVYDDRTLSVTTIPLMHRVPCCGFLFQEKPTLPHIRRDMIDCYDIPTSQINNIKMGADWVADDGTVVPNGQLVTPADPPRSFAYCSDTGYKPAIVPQIKGVDVLYHEATYLEELKDAAQRYQHSTAKQAAKIALKAEVGKLIIGHFSARVIDQELFLQEAKEVFPNVELAQDKTVYDFDK
jgi:ribonuclease Z